MRGARAKQLRRAAAIANAGGAQPAISYRRLKRARPPRRVHPPAAPRRSMRLKSAAAVARGAAERAERRRLTEGLAAQPWMSMERLRRVAAERRGA